MQFTYEVQTAYSILTVKDQCELVEHRFDSIKLQKPTMQIMIVMSGVIHTREQTIFTVEKMQTNHLHDAAKLFPASLTGSPYNDCVEVMF